MEKCVEELLCNSAQNSGIAPNGSDTMIISLNQSNLVVYMGRSASRSFLTGYSIWIYLDMLMIVLPSVLVYLHKPFPMISNGQYM